MPAPVPASHRARLVRLIHVAKRDLALDEDTYRSMLLSTTGKDTSSHLNVTELERVLAHLKRHGFKVRHATGKPRAARKPPSRALADSAQSSKIRALWLELHAQGAVRDPSEKALAAYVKRITRIDALQWLDVKQASQLIETLKQWKERLGLAQQEGHTP